MKISDFQIRNYNKLDSILVQLCEMVIKGQQQDPDYYGMVGAAVIDSHNNIVTSTSTRNNGRWIHAERNAVDKYRKQYGNILSGSIIITTLSPCSDHMSDRYGASCTDFINGLGVHKVYCGYEDPTQHPEHKTFHTKVTKNKKINQLCKALADTFLKEKLNELDFLGSPCTKDCSGHRAGYEWSRSKGGRPGNSPYSPSFNNGANLFVSGK